MRGNFYKLFGILSFFILLSCAQQRTLTGGEVDRVGPVLSSSSPPNYSKNFNSKTIYLEFDEYLQLNDAKNQLIVSPPLQKSPKIELKNKSVTITFNEELRENTTYAMNFGDGIQDFTEGNPTKDFRYVFSTGSYIDSLVVKGKVINAFTNQSEEGIRVMLYKADNDSLPYFEKPDYLTKSDEDGNFIIGNVAEGDYKIFALEDSNSDYLIDEGEALGFKTSRINAAKDDSLTILHKISISTELPSSQYIEYDDIDSIGGLKLVMHRKTTELLFDVIESEEDQFFVDYESDPDTIYFSSINPYLKNTEFKVEISEKGEVIDTLFLQTYDNVKSELKIKKGLSPSINAQKEFYLEFNHVLGTTDESQMKLIEDSVEIPFTTEIKDGVSRKLTFNAAFKDDKEYSILALPNALESVNGFTNDSLNINFKTYNKKYFGSIKLNFSGIDSIINPLIIFYDRSGKEIFKQEIVDNQIFIKRLEPGTYAAKLIEDKNKNGKWDPSAYFQGSQAEKVYIFPDELKLRSDWVLDFDWNIIPKSD